MVSAYLLILIALTDFNTSEDSVIFDKLGLVVVSVVLIAFIINFLAFIYNIWAWLVAVYKNLKEKCEKKKKKEPRKENYIE